MVTCVIGKYSFVMLLLYTCTADAVQHGPVTVLVKPGVSERLLFPLEKYAKMLSVLRAVKMFDKNFPP